MTAKPLPCGSWPSPISASLLAGQQRRLSELCLDGELIYWLESRPWEAGRNVLMCRTPQGNEQEVLPADISVRSLAHEYGGGSYTVNNGNLYFINAKDQRIYHCQHSETPVPVCSPLALTPAGPYRYADICIDPHQQRLICVREDFSNSNTATHTEPVASLVSIATDGSQHVEELAAGSDFYASPSLSPDGQQLCWLSWNHPNMPWDSTSCNLASIDPRGRLYQVRIVAGAGANDDHPQSVFQPQWSPDGKLYLVSDRNNWWNIYCYDDQQLLPVTELEAEFATPQWVFGMSTYGFIDSNTLLACYSQHGQWQLCQIQLDTRTLTPIELPYTDISQVRANSDRTVFLAASPTQAQALVEYDSRLAEQRQVGDGAKVRTRVTSWSAPIDSDYLSRPQAFSFASGDRGSALAHAFYYPPTNPTARPLPHEKPPLLVLGHGGPTGACETGLNLKIQYWTSRGFAVVDVNYRGSTGYGRDYRNQLRGQWGVADVEDVCAAAEHLVAQGLADPERLAIRGSSAGGYTVLAALTFRDTFKAGASIYGIGDLETLACDTHKFEARYLDNLVGPYPQSQALYRARSPIHHASGLTCPVIFLQGLEDKVVPPAQAETMVNCLRQQGIPVAYLTFAGEGHGFRSGTTIQRALEAEYHFYSQIFGFSCPADIEPVALQ